MSTAVATAPTASEERDGQGTTADPRHDRTVLIVALAVMAVTTAVAVIANALTRPVNSDDLAWQRLLDIWGGQGHAQAWISEDLFPTRYPLYLVLDALGIHGRRGVNVAAVLLDVAAGAAFVGGLVLSRELARPLRWRVVPALAVVSVWAAVTWDQVFFSPNTRTLEFGLSVLLLAILGLLAARDPLPVGPVAAVTALATLIWVSDPFVLYVVGAPAALVAVIDLALHERRRGRVVLVVVTISGVVSWIIHFGFKLFDVTLRPVAGGARHLTALGDLPERTRAVFDRVVALLGVSGTDLTSGPVGATALAWLRLGLVVLGVTGAVLTVRRWRDASLLARTLVVCIVSTPVAVVLVNVYEFPDAVIDRYLGAALVGLGGLAVIAVDRLSGRAGRVAVTLMAALVIGAFAANVVSWSEDRDANPDAASLALAHAVDGQLWDRVYGWYWTAVRSDQIIQGRPRWIHVECDHGGRLRLMPWHNDTAVLRGHPATIAVALDDLGCSLRALERTYGPATRTTTLEGTRFAVWETADASPRLRTLT
ncbi:MAG TPA: hypothetical protein VIH82_05060 [Acidimicrobiia bacterium]